MKTLFNYMIIFTEGSASEPSLVSKFYAPTPDTAEKIARAYVKSVVAASKTKESPKKLTKNMFKLYPMNKK